MDTIKVLIVDDSAIIRGFISQILQPHPAIEIVGSAHNGEIGVRYFQKYKPDIVTMDIEMPEMNGIDALKAIMNLDKRAKVIMCSTLSTKNADITMEAMSIGAADCIAKPLSNAEVHGSSEFRDQLLRMVLSIGGQGKNITPPTNTPQNKNINPNLRQPSKADIETQHMLRGSIGSNAPAPVVGDKVTLRSMPTAYRKPKILAIGSSTGGPQALFKFLENMNGQVHIPIVITQHMPPTFTEMLAKHIHQKTGLPAKEGAEGDILHPGHIYVAPGGKHMAFKEKGSDVVVQLLDSPPENFCKPAVDPMLRSLIDIYGKNVLNVILTGMGQDGLKGAAALVDQGAILVAQDEASSVVWGMPGSVAKAGLCHYVLPIDQLGRKALDIISKGQ